MKGSSSKALVDRAVAGCREAFEELMAASRSRLEALVRLRMGAALRSRLEVDDILQETCLEAFGSIQTFRWTGDESFFRWLGGIAEHVIQNTLRKLKAKKRRGAGAIGPFPGASFGGPGNGAGVVALAPADAASPLKALLREERFARLEKALRGLSEQHREVIVLARVRGLPIKDIAQEMGSTPAAVSMMLVRALRKLRVAFGDTGSFSLPPWSLDPGVADGRGDVPSGGESGAT